MPLGFSPSMTNSAASSPPGTHLSGSPRGSPESAGLISQVHPAALPSLRALAAASYEHPPAGNIALVSTPYAPSRGYELSMSRWRRCCPRQKTEESSQEFHLASSAEACIAWTMEAWRSGERERERERARKQTDRQTDRHADTDSDRDGESSLVITFVTQNVSLL